MNEIIDWQKIGRLNIGIDRDRCIGSGNCVKVAPEVLQLDEQSVATFRPDLIEIPEDRLIEACEVCPVDALHARDEKGSEIVPSPLLGGKVPK